jgi:hypothetical protein
MHGWAEPTRRVFARHASRQLRSLKLVNQTSFNLESLYEKISVALTAWAPCGAPASSVTMFGVVDLSSNSIKNGNANTQSLQSNQLNSNRLGFRGIEDLGGGLKAGFWLEAGMANENGALGGGNGVPAPSNGSSIFNRRSTLSVFTPWARFAPAVITTRRSGTWPTSTSTAPTASARAPT